MSVARPLLLTTDAVGGVWRYSVDLAAGIGGTRGRVRARRGRAAGHACAAAGGRGCRGRPPGADRPAAGLDRRRSGHDGCRQRPVGRARGAAGRQPYPAARPGMDGQRRMAGACRHRDPLLRSAPGGGPCGRDRHRTISPGASRPPHGACGGRRPSSRPRRHMRGPPAPSMATCRSRSSTTAPPHPRPAA